MISRNYAWGWSRPLANVMCGMVVLTGIACNEPAEEETNAPEQEPAEVQDLPEDSLVYMADNALLADMSMSPAHFVPHTSELNALGAKRLQRYAYILRMYGGTLRYDGSPANESLVERRLEGIKAFLVSAGVESERFDAEEGLAGGAGLRSSEALLIRETTTFTPEISGQSGGGADMFGGSGSSSGS